jgi:hypothetical protein
MKTVTVPMGQGAAWVDLGAGPMIISAVMGDCVFATGDEAPTYSLDVGFPIPSEVPLVINTTLHVWGRLAPDAMSGEILVGPL